MNSRHGKGPLHGAFGRDYPRDLFFNHVQMRDLQHARGSASGHYNDRGGKSGGDEERGRERDRYNERDRNRDWQCDADSAKDRDRGFGSDRDREYTQPSRLSKLFNHGNELNSQMLNNRDTIELSRGRDAADTQKDRGKDRGEDRGRDSRDRNDRNNERDRNTGCQRSRDGDRDRNRDRGSGRDRQYTLTQRPSKQFNIELNKQVIRYNLLVQLRISDTRKLGDFISTHVAEFNHVNVATAFFPTNPDNAAESLRRHCKHLRSLLCKACKILKPKELPTLYTLWRSRGTKRQVPFCWRWSGGRQRYQGSSTRSMLQTRCGRLRQWGQAGGADDGAAGRAGRGDIRRSRPLIR